MCIVVKRKVIKRGSVSHVEEEKTRLGDKFDVENESALESLPYSMNLSEIPIDSGIRAPRSVINLPPLPEATVESASESAIPDALPPKNSGETDKEDVFSYRDIPVSDSYGRTLKEDKRSILTKIHDKGHNALKKFGLAENKRAGTGRADDDEMAIRGGVSTSKEELINRKQSAIVDQAEIQVDIDNRDQEMRRTLDAIRNYEEVSQRKRDLEYKQYASGEPLSPEDREEYVKLTKLTSDPVNKRKYEMLSSEYKRLQSDRYELDKKDRLVKDRYNKAQNDIERYNVAVIRGRDAYNKEHGVRREWIKPFAENVENMISKPNIGDISQQVGYGDLTGKSFSTGMNAVVGKVKVTDTANDWVKTKVGDRGLVEALVKVNQNNMITPFGAPGTIQNSRLGDQFSYKLPVRQIGVGEVTARPGYRLTPEDIHRKKKDKSKPAIERKQPVKSKSKSDIKKVAVKGSLSMNMNSPIIASIGSTKSNSVRLTMDNIKPFTAKNIEINMNKISSPINKRKILKVKK